MVLCAITGRDRTSTTSAPRTTTSSFLDFIRFSSISLVTPDAMTPNPAESEHNCSLRRARHGDLGRRRMLLETVAECRQSEAKTVLACLEPVRSKQRVRTVNFTACTTK